MPNGKQLYHCRECGRQSRQNPTSHAYPEARREEILHAYQERSSLTRTFGVSRTTVSNGIKKVAQLPPLRELRETFNDLVAEAEEVNR